MTPKHFPPEQQKQLLAQWQASGLSGEKFATQQGLPAGAIWRWRKKWLTAESNAPGFQPVNIISATTLISKTHDGADPIARVLVGKLVVEIYPGSAEKDLENILIALNEVRA